MPGKKHGSPWMRIGDQDTFACAVDHGVDFWPEPPSVCSASQTSAAMMISGKSALRKKRFKRGLAGRVPDVY